MVGRLIGGASVRDINVPSRKFLPLQAAPGLVDGWLSPPDTDPLVGLFGREGLPAVEKVRRTPVSTLPYDGAGLCFR